MQKALVPLNFQCLCQRSVLLLFFAFLSLPSFGNPSEVNVGEILNTLEEAPIDPADLNPQDLVHWTLMNSTYDNGGGVFVQLNLETDKDFTIYADQLQITSRSGLDLVKIETPKAEEIPDPLTGEQAQVYSGGSFLLHFKGDAIYEKEEFPVSIRYIACSLRICLFPYTEHITVPTYKSEEDMGQKLGASKAVLSSAESLSLPKKEKENLTLEEEIAERLSLGNLGLFMMLLALFIGGVLTNLTPCVYPMIPITISILGRYTAKPILGSAVYASGIVLVYSLLGLSVGLTGSLFGQYMASPFVNILLAFVMCLLALSMLGFGNWNFLAQLGYRLGMGKPSLKQAFLMGCGAGLVASPCTGPILASILTYIVANEDIARSTLYIFVYSLGFGLPYIFLGSLSGSIANLSVSPKIQVSVKVFFASLMFALCFYYLRIPLYDFYSQWDKYWKPFTMISFFLGMIAWRFNWYAQTHKKMHALLIVPGLLLGISIFSGSRWLFEEQTEPVESSILWYDNEKEALDMASYKGYPLLIDFWAEWCAACKKMDADTFSDLRFIEEAQNLNLLYLKLDVTEDTPENKKLLEKYKVQGLPTIVIIKPGASQPIVVSGYASAARLLNYLN